MAMSAPDLEKTARAAREENQFRFVVNVISRRWILLVLGTVCGAILFGLLPMLVISKPATVYTATTQLLVLPSRWEQYPLKDIVGAPLFQNTPKALVNRIPSRSVARDVVRGLVQQDIADGQGWTKRVTEKDYAAGVEEILATLTIAPNDVDGRIDITCQHTNDRDARRIAELAARSFVSRNRDLLLMEGEETHAFVRKQLEELQKQLDLAERDEWQFRKSMGFRKHDQVVKRMDAWNSELVEAQTTKEQMLAKLAQIEAGLNERNEQLPASLGQVTDSVVKELLRELDEMLREQLTMSIQYTDAYPPLQELEEEINEKKQAILEAVGRLEMGLEGGSKLWEERQALHQQYMQIQLDVVALDIRAATIRKLLEKLMQELPELNEKNLAHQRLVRQVTQLRSQFDRLLDKELEVRSSLQRGTAQLDRSSPVTLSSKPSGGIKTEVNFLIGALVGFVVGFGFAMVIELNDTSIHSAEDVTQYIGLDVIGTIPKMRFGKGRSSRRGNYVALTDEEQIHACIVTQHDPKSPISEAYRTLRTRFQLATIQQKPKTIVVTSAVPGEGKTTTAVNMAVTFADSGMRVLLVDTDLRRPNVHHVLRMERGPGLADILRDGVDPHSVIRPTRVENLWMVSSGRVPPNPSELIGSDRMRRLMRELGSEFDLVICDAPSILVVTDPVLISTDVDTVVLVMAVEYVRRETIIHGKKLLDTANANIAGVVLNGLAASRRHYYYYYYYYDDAAPRRQRKWYHL